MKKLIIPFLLITPFVLATSCSTEKKEVEENSEATVATETNTAIELPAYPKLLTDALEAHGGLGKWNGFGSLQYDLTKEEATENHLIDLWSRKVLLKTDKGNIGFDGKEVWATPNKAAFGKMSPRFYHNLYFYFFGIPYLLADPGIKYEEMGTKEVNGIAYDALKVSYGAGVGDSPEDLYIALFNKDTHKLELVLYTVTYFSREKTEKYNALVYGEWQEANGLLVPKSFKGYKFENDSLKEQRYEATFENVKFESKAPESSLFEMPEGAEIDTLKI